MTFEYIKNYTKISFLSLATLTAASSWASAETSIGSQYTNAANPKLSEALLVKNKGYLQVASLQETQEEDDHGHDEEEEGEGDGHAEETTEENGEGLKISGEGQKLAGIQVEPLSKKSVPSLLNAPGEIMVNNYFASVVTPRIPAIVQKRHAYLGDEVAKGATLVTMFSVDMAEAQGDHLVATQEWVRVERLGKNIVSSKRYTETYLAFQQSKARLKTFGMSEDQITAFTNAKKSANLGFFDLVAVGNGVIVKDDFRLGEVIEPGRNLFEIVDEDTVWVDTKISINESNRVKPGTKAIVKTGKQTRNGVVKQIYRQMDETTRTIGLRVELDNLDRTYKPGQFVDVDLVLDPTPVMSVPTEAVFQTEDGDWAVFVESANGSFQEKEIEKIRTTLNRIVIEGLPVGTRVVTQGAFFVKSEAAKGNFQVHNH